jgi:hypothetical protein
MYREDLERFIGFFQTACEVVAISDGKNRYDSLDEMKAENGPKISNLDIRGERPGLHFLLDRQETVHNSSTPTTVIFNELRTEEVTDEADALFFKVQEFLLEHQRPWARWPFALLSFITLCGAIISVARHDRVGTPPLLIALLWTISFAVCAVLGFKVDNLITLNKRIECQSFWSRNKESLAKHAITAAISAIFGGIAGWIFGHMSK